MTQEKSREEEKELELEMKIYEQRVKKTNEAVHFLAQFGIGFIWRVVTVLVEEKDIANQRVFPGLAEAVGQRNSLYLVTDAAKNPGHISNHESFKKGTGLTSFDLKHKHV